MRIRLNSFAGMFPKVHQSRLQETATDKAKKRDFTADERQTLPKSLEAYVNSLKKTG